MKKAIAVVALLVVAAAAFAEGPSAEKPFALTGRLDTSVCLGAVYITPELAFAWQPGLLGAGVEVRSLTDISSTNTYLAALGVFRLGWLSLGAGVGVPLLETTSVTMGGSVVPAVTLGLDIPVFNLGPGNLGINLSADWMITSIEADSSSSSLGNAIGSALLTAWGSVKVSAGVEYTLPL